MNTSEVCLCLLLERIKEGDQEAFNKVVSWFQSRVLDLALRITGNEMDAQEITQDVFLTVWTKIVKFEGRSSFSSWLHRITINQALMNKRKNKKFCSSEHFGEVHLISTPGMALEGKDLLAHIGSFERELSPKDRSAFHLIDIDGVKIEDAAGLLGITVPSIKSRLHRARTFVREKISVANLQ